MRYLGRFLPWYALPRKPPSPTLPRKPPAPTLLCLPPALACARMRPPRRPSSTVCCVWWARGTGGGGDSSSSSAPALIVVVAQSAVVRGSGSVYSHFGPFTLQSRAARSSMVAAGGRRLKCEWSEGVNCRGQTSPPPRVLCLIRIGRCVAPAERRLLAKRAARLSRQPRPDALGVEVVLACEREHAISDNVPVGIREGAVVSTCMRA
jgi:hypothetical protein